MALIAALSGSGRLSLPLASCPAQVGRPLQHPLEWTEEQNSHWRDGRRRWLVGAGREVKAQLLPMRIVAVLNRSAHGSLVQNIFVRSIDQLMATRGSSYAYRAQIY